MKEPYDNTAGTVAVMLYAKALLEIELDVTPSLHCGLVKKRACEVQTPLLTTIVTIVYHKTRNLDFTSTWI